jgi:hypothetical protein
MTVNIPLSSGPTVQQFFLRAGNRPQTIAELDVIRTSVQRRRPFGSEAWQVATAQKLGLESAFQPRGRPRNLLEETMYPAEELICNYHERFENELVYDEQKTHQDPRRATKPAHLRTESPAGLVQEAYALSLGHCVVRTLMFQAAQKQAPDPDRLSCWRKPFARNGIGSKPVFLVPTSRRPPADLPQTSRRPPADLPQTSRRSCVSGILRLE